MRWLRWALLAVSVLPALPLSGQACRSLGDRRVDTVRVGYGLRASVEVGALTPEPSPTIRALLETRYPALRGPAPLALFGGEVLVPRIPVLRLLLTLPGPPDSASLTAAPPFDGPAHWIEGQVRADLERLADSGAFAPLATGLKRQFALELFHGILEPADIPLLVERIEQVVALEVPARARRRGFPMPPEEARRRKLDGAVTLRFIITETGKVDPEAIRVVARSDSIFIPNAIKAMLETSFTPASSGGCPVRQEVQQTINFKFTG